MSSSEFQISVIPAGHECGWSVTIDDVEGRPGRVTIASQYGVLTYGMRPEGYDGWAFAEEGGGGSTAIPYAYTAEGELLLAMILEDRPNMGGKRWCAIGGFKNPGEDAFSAAVREAFEEAGLRFDLRQLPGVPANFNRLFTVADPEADKGVHGHAVEFPFSLLERAEDVGWQFRDDVGGEDRKALMRKGDGHVRFVPWREAVALCGDMMFRSNAMQLLAELNEI